MLKIIVYLLALLFSGDLLTYAAGPFGGHGYSGSRGANTGSGSSYRGSTGSYQGSGGSHGSGSGGSHGSYNGGSGNTYHGSPGHYNGYNGYHGGSYNGQYGHHGGRPPYHGNYHNNNHHRNSYKVWIGPVWGRGWGAYYPYRYYLYSYPYYPCYSCDPAPPVIAQQPQTYSQEEQDDNYWYFCQNPEGYYPYIKSCPGGWMKVVPDSAPPSN